MGVFKNMVIQCETCVHSAVCNLAPLYSTIYDEITDVLAKNENEKFSSEVKCKEYMVKYAAIRGGENNNA